MRPILLLLACAAALSAQMFPGPGLGQVPVPAGYLHEYTVTLGGSGQIPSTQTNFRMLVCANMTLGDGNACPTAANLKVTGSGGNVTNASGYDIGFSSTTCSTPTPLTWEMINYTGSTGAMEAWVLNPSLAAGGVFYICYDNPAITTFQGGAAGAVWGSSYSGVWHLSNGSSLSLADSSTYGNTGTNVGATAGAGNIDGGALTNGSGGSIKLPFPTLSATATWTVSMWIEQDNSAAYNVAFESSDGSRSMGIYINSAGSVSYDLGPLTSIWPTGGLTLGSLHHMLITCDGTYTYAYVDNVYGSYVNASVFSPFPAGLVTFGHNASYGATDLQGKYDEIRVSSNFETANQIAAEYHNQSAPGTFMTVASSY